MRQPAAGVVHGLTVARDESSRVRLRRGRRDLLAQDRAQRHLRAVYASRDAAPGAFITSGASTASWLR